MLSHSTEIYFCHFRIISACSKSHYLIYSDFSLLLTLTYFWLADKTRDQTKMTKYFENINIQGSLFNALNKLTHSVMCKFGKEDENSFDLID